MIALDIIFGLMIFVILFTLFFYYPTIKLLAKGKKLEKKDLEPEITVIIPAFNEEKYIKRKLRNMLDSDYPKKKMRILVVENGSTDNTVKIARGFERKNSLEVISSGSGKMNALNKGLEKAKTDIIVTSDADTIIDKSTIRNLVSYLHGDIGSVGGYPILKAKPAFYTKSKALYQAKDWDMRFLEGLVDSSCSLDGKLMAFRKSVIGRFPPAALSDDQEMTFMTKRKGLRSIVAMDAKVYEEPPSSVKDELKQIRRRAAVGIWAHIIMPHSIFNMRHKVFGFLILPFRRVFPFLFPIFSIYIVLYLFLKSALIGSIAAALGAAYILLFNRFMALQWLGVLLAYYDLISGKMHRKRQWEKINS